MKYLFLFILLSVCLALGAQEMQQNDPMLGIIPVPVSVKKGTGHFKMTPETMILSDSVNESGVKFFTEYLKKEGFYNTLMDSRSVGKKISAIKHAITLSINYKETQKPEGYELIVSEDNIVLNGKGAGLFYGVQTLIQLMEIKKGGNALIPACVIKDYPRFKYRGMHLDVSRHFFDVAFIKKYIDVLSSYKLNYFHWHLTDDQGWRIEIKKYPNLTAVGSKRAQTKVGKTSGVDSNFYDNKPYGGYYTQQEVKEIVDYANEKFVNVIPEIEMPGHSLAAIASYPELSCDADKKYKVAETWGVFPDVYCPTETTFRILGDILNEVVDLFPCKYVHIGGDECMKDVWRKSEFCQQLIREQKLRDENELQSYFITRIEKYLNIRNRTIIGWDEILEGGVAPNATIMSWRGEGGGIAAAQLNHDVVMTPGEVGLYFDHAQSRSNQEPLSIGGFAPLSKTYRYDPVPAELSADQAKHIIGVQANLWTEYIATPAKAEYMLLPRMMALSEIAWSQKGNKNFRAFEELRLPHHLSRLDREGYNYRVPEPIGVSDTTLNGDEFKVTLVNPVEGAKIYYTINGYAPRETEMVYTEPINIKVPAGTQVELQTIVITTSGKRSNIVHTYLNNGAPILKKEDR